MRIVILIFFCFASLFAKDISATYKISFGIFGQIGIAKTSLHVEGNKYKILVHAKSTGFASFVSGGREEFYESSGYIKGKLLVPNIYTKLVENRENVGDAFSKNFKTVLKKYTLIYLFDHNLKKVNVTKIREKGKNKSETKEKLKFYTKNDILTLFFNFKNLFPNLDIKKHHILYAVGANKDNGKIDIFPLSKKEFSSLIGGSLKDVHLMKVILSDKIFASKKGELYLSLNKEGFCEKAVLKDVIFFGDIRGELIEQNIK